MKSISKQRGLTAISWFFVIAFFVMFAVLLLRIIPIYLDGFAVGESVKFMETEKALLTSSTRDIKKSLLKKLNINSVYNVKADDIYVTKKRNKVIIEVDYEVRENVVGNLDFVISFNKQAVIQ